MIYAGDCRDIAWGGADVMICDPPFREHVHKSAVSQVFNSGDSYKNGCVEKRDFGFTHLTKELRDWTIAQAKSINRWSCIFSDVESISYWVEGLGKHYIRTIPWVRWSMPQMSGDRPCQGFEAIIIAHGSQKGRKSWNGPGNLVSLNHLCLRGKDKHKTEKPLDLILDLVNWFSNKGDIVIDPFSGGGTTGLACKLLGRKFGGSELDPKWAEKANKRIESPLSERDQTRYDRWKITNEELIETKRRLKAQTAKVKARLK